MPQLFAVIVLLALTIAIFSMMRRGWLRRERSIVIQELPALPVGGGEVDGGFAGVYVTTTLAGQPYERIVTRGLGVRSPVHIHVRPDGLVLTRTGARDLFIPTTHLTAVSTTSGMIGKVAGAQSIIVFTWTAGGTLVDTGVHLRNREDRQRLFDQAHALTGIR